MPLSLKEFLSAEIDSIISKIVVKKVEKRDLSSIRARLKSWFKFKPELLRLGSIVNIDGVDLEITTLTEPKARVKFTIKDTNCSFTCTKNYLMGIELDIPFKVGDSVLYKDEVCKILKLHINNYCAEIQTSVYVKEVDIKSLRKFEE